MKRIAFVVLVLTCACQKSTDQSGSATTGTGATAGTGSATAATGSATVGTGSATAGTGAAMTGSGSATAGSDAVGRGSAAGSGVESAAASDFNFDKLTHEKKLDFMKTTVMPAMKKEFQAFDAKEYDKFTCKTCHGKDPEKSKYKMPNPDLPELDLAALKAGKQKPKVAAFMAKVVKPQMAKLLNQPEYTEANQQGFGCLDCHGMKGDGCVDCHQPRK